jgi:hypothetical protein
VIQQLELERQMHKQRDAERAREREANRQRERDKETKRAHDTLTEWKHVRERKKELERAMEREITKVRDKISHLERDTCSRQDKQGEKFLLPEHGENGKETFLLPREKGVGMDEAEMEQDILSRLEMTGK